MVRSWGLSLEIRARALLFMLSSGGVLSGLEMALHYRHRKVVIEMDSLVACELINTPIVDSHPCATLLRNINRRCCDVGEVIFQHVYRKGNRVADALALLAQRSFFKLNFLTSPPGEIVSLLDEDGRGVGALSQRCPSFFPFHTLLLPPAAYVNPKTYGRKKIGAAVIMYFRGSKVVLPNAQNENPKEETKYC
ncbi:ribonuclease H [Senna tora]|uniref:Ribonuclease H n=1 Tax=Senna tora TaxID=362788 RepID=A0A834T2W5_9FABA|nr:ribonuclease H [Senna tora]